MLESATYFILLFTIQAVSVLKEAVTWEFNLIWGSLFFILIVCRRAVLFPADHPLSFRRKRQLYFWALSLIFLVISNFYLTWYVSDHNASQLEKVVLKFGHGELGGDQLERERIRLSGEVSSSVKIDGNRASFTLRCLMINGQVMNDAEKVVINHFVQSIQERDQYTGLSLGERWAGEVRLIKPDPARNPGAFDYRQYLAQQGIHYVAQVEGQVFLEEKEESRSFLQAILDLRQQWIEQTDQLFSAQIAPFVQAMTVGQWTGIDPNLLRLYQDLGLVHLLAISGLHVAIVLGVIYVLLSRFPLTRETIYAFLFLFIPCYIVFSGFNIPVIRSGLMAFVVLLCFRFNLKHHALIGLYLVYIVMVWVQPYVLFQAGFQLSFAVTFALLTVVPKVYPYIPGKVNWIKQGIAVALMAQIVSLPIILFHFYAFSPLSLFLNMILVPIYSALFIPGAYVLTTLSFADVKVISLLLWSYERSFELLHQLLSWLYELPYMVVNTGRPSWWWLCLVVLAILWLTVWAERGGKRRVWIGFALFPLLLTLLLVLPYLDQNAYVTILDVGQGDAIVIETPYRQEVVLIDVGGSVRLYREDWQEPSQPFEVGRDVILPYLKYRGINHVDKIVISHGHYDHWGGLEGLLGQIPIGMVIHPPLAPQSDPEKEWLAKIQHKQIPLYFVDRGDGWRTADAQFLVLYPEVDDQFKHYADHVHRYNLVLWNKIYNTTFLWTGDVEEEGEHDILDTYPHLETDVLKVAHHGSRTSSSERWLERIKPDVSVISAGRFNLYGHPHEEVLWRLGQSGSTLFNTAWHGAIFIVVKPSGYSIVPTLQPDWDSVQ